MNRTDSIRLVGERCFVLAGCSRRYIDRNAATMSRVCLSGVGSATVPQMRRDVYPFCTVGWPSHVVVSGFTILLVAGALLVWRLLFFDGVVGVGLAWVSRLGRFDGTSALSSCLTTCVWVQLLA